nr:hypothetical protein [Streptomyces sp. CB01580]
MTTHDTKLIKKAVTITGTRNTGHRPPVAYDQLFTDYLGPFVHGGHFYLGGAMGIDSLSLLWLAERTDAGITVVAPGTVGQQPAEAQQAITRTRDRIAEIVELGAADLRASAYHARNQWMVDHTSLTIGFPHATEPSSGTWQTIDYTAEQGKPRLIVPV